MKRIVKETLSSGKVRYIIQTNSGFFGLLNTGWHTDNFMHSLSDGSPIRLEAVFDTLEEAKEYYGLYKKVINKEVLYEANKTKI